MISMFIHSQVWYGTKSKKYKVSYSTLDSFVDFEKAGKLCKFYNFHLIAHIFRDDGNNQNT